MRERYVEEQMYSEKIRQTSTWWTLGLISTNLLLFLMIHFILEPRKKEKWMNQIMELVQQSSKTDHEILERMLINHLNTSQYVAPISNNEQPLPAITIPQTGVDGRNYHVEFWKGLTVGSLSSAVFFLLFFRQ
ncbi:Mdm33 family-domain-containing protein [Globomyces pollinis-pini]|nr:Mdm33 family-domain-containing protein [Globomyces pollinis-pini]